MEFYLIIFVIVTVVITYFILYRKSYCVVKIGEKYAVRRGVFIYEYKDFYGSYWWSQGGTFFGCCLTDDINKARNTLTIVADKGTRV